MRHEKNIKKTCARRFCRLFCRFVTALKEQGRTGTQDRPNFWLAWTYERPSTHFTYNLTNIFKHIAFLVGCLCCGSWNSLFNSTSESKNSWNNLFNSSIDPLCNFAGDLHLDFSGQLPYMWPHIRDGCLVLGPCRPVWCGTKFLHASDSYFFRILWWRFRACVCRSAGFVPSVQWGLNFQTPGNATILSSGGIHACVIDTNKKARPIRGAVVKKSSSYFQLRSGMLGVLSCFINDLILVCARTVISLPLSLSLVSCRP